MKTPTPSPIRAMRTKARVSLDQLAFAVGCSAATLSRAERGYYELRPDVYERVVATLTRDGTKRT